MPTIRAKIRCYATYETELDVPDGIDDLEYYVQEHMSELSVENLEFFDDLDEGFLVSADALDEGDDRDA